MKIKPFSGTKTCPDGERYVFRKGIAVVKGMEFGGKPVHITIVEFNKFCKENKR